jgi:lipid A oxidase
MNAFWLKALLGIVLLLGSPSWGEAEWFVDLYAGKSLTLNEDIKIKQPANNSNFTVEDVSFDDESFKDPPYYGVRVGHFFEQLPSLGLALEFFHFKMLADTNESKRFTGTRNGAPISTVQPVNSVVQRFNISHGVNYLTLDAILRGGFFQEKERFPRGRLQAYGGIGPGLVITHPENRVEGVNNSEEYEISGFGVQAFVGAKLLLFRHFGLFGEYKFTHSSLDVDLSTGSGSVDENTHHAVFGITVPFR